MDVPRPQRIAFCWLHGWEMGKEAIKRFGCTDPGKQIYGICEHIMFYGDKKEAMDLAELQAIYDNMVRDLAKKGVRLEGRNINLVQAMPGGCKVKLSIGDAEKVRRERFKSKRCM